MFKRLIFLGVMSAAIGIPYVVTSTNVLGTGGGKDDGPPGVSFASLPSAGGAKTPNAPGGPATRPPEGEATPLAEVLQFNASPAWVMSRWPRVTTGLADVDLHGYRVTLITGTGQDDLAGSLTYYFNKEQHVERITFHGWTGDPRKLIGLVTSRYELAQQPTSEPGLGLFQAKWNGKPQSELRIKPASTVRADQPHARYEIELALKKR